MFGLFSKQNSVDRAKKKVLNKLAQSVDRMAAMEKLVDQGDEDSVFTLCKRFSYTYTKMVEDEEEKAWLVRTLIGMGETALPGLRKYMLVESAVAYPLRILEEVVDKEKALDLLDELLSKEPPGYVRDTSKRTSYIDWLSEYDKATNEEVAPRITPYLADYDETVRFKAVEAIGLRPIPSMANALAQALLRPEEESGRLKERICQVLVDNQCELTNHKKAIQTLLENDAENNLHRFRFQKKHLVEKKS